jgi:sec-independent protein translocase protein TatC
MKPVKMRLVDHMYELRNRVIYCATFFVLAFGFGWFVAPYFQDVLLQPLMLIWADGMLLYTSITDGVMVRLNLSMIIALVLICPFVIYQIWQFITPGISKTEGRALIPFVIASPIFFIIGAAFVYFFLMPLMFKFFISFSDANNISLLPSIASYIKLTLGFIKTFGIAFQFPIIMVILNRIGIVSRKSFVKSRRYAYVGIVIIAAILTPPDVISQIALSIPMILLFEGAVLMMKKD